MDNMVNFSLPAEQASLLINLLMNHQNLGLPWNVSNPLISSLSGQFELHNQRRTKQAEALQQLKTRKSPPVALPLVDEAASPTN